MATPDLMEPIADGEFGPAQARHLLARAGLGGTAAQVRYLVKQGLDGAIATLVDYERFDASRLPEPQIDPDVIRPPTQEEKLQVAMARRQQDEAAMDRFRTERLRRLADDREQFNTLAQWWLGRMVATPRPLEESLTLLWHGHFATRHRNVRDTFLMYRQNQMFRRFASASFASLALGIVRDPAMLRFLNNDSNNRRKPNENLARELMELFTLGEGNYTEQDIQQGARALTGYTVNDNDFEFSARMHDTAGKTILGQTGKFDGDAFVEILLRRPQCARFIAGKLYRHFVGDIDGEATPVVRAYVDEIARLLIKHEYALKPVLKAMLASRHFYSPQVRGNKIKTPVQLVVGTIRSLDLPVRDLAVMNDALTLMGQQLFDPPSVAGWDGGQAWINTSTLFIRQNVATYLLTGKVPYGNWSAQDVSYDPMPLVADVKPDTAAALVDRLLEVTMDAPVSESRRAELVKFVGEMRDPWQPEAVLGTLLVITAMPEYQLC